MKYIISPVLFLCFFTSTFAQQNTTINNALLLEYYQNQRFDQAADYLKQTYPEPITDIKILKALAYCSQMNGKLADAETYYGRVYMIDSTSTAVLYSLGSISMRRGNEQRAANYYQRIILHDSTNFIVYKQLARISLNKKDIIATINYLQRANRLNPEEPDVASDLADLYISLKLYAMADKVLSLAIAADPENMTLLESLVKLEYGQKKWPETASNCEKLLQLSDMSGATLTHLGVAYFNMQNYQCSIESFGQIAENEQTETTCYYTGACYKAMKNYDKAILYFQKTIDLGISPNINSYYTEIADTYETTKRYKKAGVAYQKALQFTQTPITWYSLANMYDTELKDRKMALSCYKKYLAAKPPQTQKNYIVYAKNRINVLSR